MKYMKRYTFLLLCALSFASCAEDKLDVDFGTDTKTIAIGPDGGKAVSYTHLTLPTTPYV